MTAALKLDLGCGRNKHEGCMGVDIRRDSDADVIADLNLGIPFPENTISEIFAFHVIEHLEDWKRFLNEHVWRACKNGAPIHIRVPYFLSEGNLHLAHKDVFGVDKLKQFCDNNHQFGLKSIGLGFAENSRFDFISPILNWKPLRFFADEVRVELEVVK